MKWLNDKVAPPSEVHYEKALAHQRQLTKPPGSLGRLEDLAARLAAMQRTERPALDAISVAVFAADHGIAEAGVSAFPQAVTREMVKNFMRGGAACNVLAGCVGADFEAVDAGLLAPLEISGLVSDRAGPGTVNFLNGPAMSEAQLAHAVAAGRRAVARALERRAQLFIGGDMGIGNTTSAAALGCALLDEAPEHLTGAGTGLDPNGIRHKAGVIEQALTRHRSASTAPLAAMQCLGGFEIAALTGAYVFAAQQGLPVLIDGFISSVAALCAVRI
ncbi:MAG: nicotinate-nucleotide--dimethylbenzimidazole phosphoribosyltransferase, partial [Gammaproteobacteria bacterium]